MKKTAALCIVFCLLLAAFPVPAFATEGEAPLCFAVASDLHYSPTDASLIRVNDDPLYWYANRRAAMENESGFLIDSFLSACAADPAVRYVLLSGDLADNGKWRPEDHIAVAQKLRRFEADCGKQVFVINGNHDASENPGDTSFADFKRIYAEFGYDHALTQTDYDCSYTADLGDDCRLIALDSCHRTASTEDGMTLQKVRWVLSAAAEAKRDGRRPVLMLHHNLLDHLPAQRLVSHDFIVRFHRSTAALFAEAGIRLVLSGHEHCSDATGFVSPAGATLYDFATTSLTMYPLAYRVFTLTDDAIAYESRTLSEIDTAALSAATAGYTDAQLAAMRADLNGYAKGFFRAGVRYRLSLSLTDEKLGISESDVWYPLVKTAVSGLTRLLETPYAGENGLIAQAARWNIALPESEYETPWDLVTALAAAHYEGEERFPPDSPAVRLLLKTVALLLKTDLADVADEVFLGAANRLLDREPGLANRASRLCAAAFGGITPGGRFLAALLSPLLYEFACDGDGVPDNNGRIPGYGDDDRPQTLLQRFSFVVRRALLYFDLFFSALF